MPPSLPPVDFAARGSSTLDAFTRCIWTGCRQKIAQDPFDMLKAHYGIDRAS